VAVSAAMTGAPVTAAMSATVAAGATAATVAAVSTTVATAATVAAVSTTVATAATVAAVSTTVATAATVAAMSTTVAAAVTPSAVPAAAPSGPAPVPDTGGTVGRPAACRCALASTAVGLVLRVTRSRVRRRWTAAGPRARYGSSFSAPVPRKSRDRRTIARRFTGAGTASVGGPL